MAKVIVDAPRNADFATLDQPLKPGCDVHAVPENVLVLDHDVADIDANPEAHPPSFRLTFVRLPKRRLISIAQRTASRTLPNSASRLSPAVLAIRPR
jgi:hypothetical protein